jgi:hypothetical protein
MITVVATNLTHALYETFLAHKEYFASVPV